MRILRMLGAASRHPLTALMGAREFRDTSGMTYDDDTRTDAYDSGRELAHMLTLRRFEPFRF